MRTMRAKLDEKFNHAFVLMWHAHATHAFAPLPNGVESPYLCINHNNRKRFGSRLNQGS